jgi:hypothetical protein
MSKQLQSNCASSLHEDTSNVIVQDPLTTNRLLARNKTYSSNLKKALHGAYLLD